MGIEWEGSDDYDFFEEYQGIQEEYDRELEELGYEGYEGFSIIDESKDMQDEAQDWLDNNDIDSRLSDGEDPKEILQELFDKKREGRLEESALEGWDAEEGHVYGFGMASPSVLMEERFRHMEYRVQAFVKEVIKEPDLWGQRSSHKDISSISTSAAVRAFGRTIGEDPVKWASRLKIPEGVQPTRDIREQKMALDMLGLTAEGKLRAGPGERLIGTYLSDVQAKEAEEELKWALNRVPEIAELYLLQGTKNKDPELYGERVKTATGKLINYWVNQERPADVLIELSTGLPLKDSKDSTQLAHASSIAPLPSELEMLGTIQTASTFKSKRFGHQGSPFTMKEFKELYPDLKELTGNGTKAWDKSVWEKSEASRYTVEELGALLPSRRLSLFPTSIYGTESKERFKALEADMKKIRDILRRNMLTVIDENYGNTRRSLSLGLSEEQLARQEVFNEAALLDLDRYKKDYRSMTKDEIKTYGKGTDKGGMYQNIGISEVDLLMEEVMEGLKEDDEENTFIGPSLLTERQQYLRDVESKLYNEEIFPQRTPGWYKQKEGKVSGSMVGNVLTSKGQENLAKSLVENEKVLPNAAMKLGADYEKTAKASFELTSGLVVEEAYFTEKEGLEGFGVSPDGYVFDKYGRKQGLAEFKVHTTEAAMKNPNNGVKKYMNQMQLQMAVTGEDKVHFFRINAETREYEYDVVYADKELQDKVLAGGKAALEIGENMKRMRLKGDLPLPMEEEEIAPEDVAKVYKPEKEEKEEPATVFMAEDRPSKPTSKLSKLKASEDRILRGEELVDKAEIRGKERLKESEEKATAARKAMYDKEYTKRGAEIIAINRRTEQAKKEEDRRLTEEGMSILAINKRTEDAKKERDREFNKKGEEILAILKRTSDMEEEAAKSKKKSAEELNKAFNNTISSASKLAANLGVIAASGNKTAIEIERTSQLTGMTTAEVEGQETLLRREGMEVSSVHTMLRSIGEYQASLQEPVSGSQVWADRLKKMIALRSKDGGQIEGITEGFGLGDFTKAAQMTSKETTTNVIRKYDELMAKGEDAAARNLLGIWGAKDFSVTGGRVSASAYEEARGALTRDEVIDAYRGEQSAKAVEQKINETVSKELGEEGNLLLGLFNTAKGYVSGVAEPILGGVTGAYLYNKLMGGAPASAAISTQAASGLSTLSKVWKPATAIAAGVGLHQLLKDRKEGEPLITDEFTSKILYGQSREDAFKKFNITPRSDIGTLKSDTSQPDKDTEKVSLLTNTNVTVTLGENVVITRAEDNFGNTDIDTKAYNQ